MSKKTQVHKRIVLLFMKEVFEAYDHKRISLAQGMDMLGLSRSHFFRYLKAFRQNGHQFGIKYVRSGPNRTLTADENAKIADLLRREKEILSSHSKIKKMNFQALKKELEETCNLFISAETIRCKAIEWKFHSPKKRGVKIYRELQTTKIGRLFQHDTCVHQWSPYMEPFYLILTVDDHSRRIVCARFFDKETSMNHILCVRDTVMKFGLPLAYYTDKHSIFTYSEKESYRYRFQTKTEDAAVQWQRVMRLLEIQSILANSPQAKGKVESKFKYLQGRVVRRCAKEQAKTIEEAQRILNEEVTYYNQHKAHAITGQTPKERWDLAKKQFRSVLRPIVGLGKDIFCLEYEKKLDSYGRCKIKGTEIQVKKAASKKVIIRYIEENGEVEIRIWCDDDLIQVIQG